VWCAVLKRRARDLRSGGSNRTFAPHCRSHWDRYTTSKEQLAALTAQVRIQGIRTCVTGLGVCVAGSVLDPSGCRKDAVHTLLDGSPGIAFVRCNDLDGRLPADWHLDATLPELWRECAPADWVVGSPPYSCARMVLEHALEFAQVGVALKLRLSFLEPCLNRVDLLSNNPPTQLVVLPRETYVGGSADWMVEAWFVWRRVPPAQRIHTPIAIVSREQLENLTRA
jgi:hypothetical protein